MESPIENREAKIDFLKIFNDRLQDVEPVTSEKSKGLVSLYDNPEITQIKREVPVIFFDPNNLEGSAPPTDMWIENPKNLDEANDLIHNQIVEKLGKFLAKSNIKRSLSGYVLEDGNGVLYLVLDDVRAGGLRSDIKYIKYNEQKVLAVLDILNKYKISKVLEKSSRTIPKTKETSIEVIGKSMLDERREYTTLINLARKHGMTNSQYLRFKILADSLFRAGQQVSLDEIAESIVKDPDNENIPVKHLPLG